MKPQSCKSHEDLRPQCHKGVNFQNSAGKMWLNCWALVLWSLHNCEAVEPQNVEKNLQRQKSNSVSPQGAEEWTVWKRFNWMPKVLLWNKLHTTDTVAFWCSEIPHNHLFSRIINDSNTLPLVGSKDFFWASFKTSSWLPPSSMAKVMAHSEFCFGVLSCVGWIHSCAQITLLPLRIVAQWPRQNRWFLDFTGRLQVLVAPPAPWQRWWPTRNLALGSSLVLVGSIHVLKSHSNWSLLCVTALVPGPPWMHGRRDGEAWWTAWCP